MGIIRQILQLKTYGHSNRRISSELGIGRNTVNHYLKRLLGENRTAAEMLTKDDETLHMLIKGSTETYSKERQRLLGLYDLFPQFERELGRTGMTRMILWERYCREHSVDLSYGRFCTHYSRWKKRKGSSMHMEHLPGDKLFVDFTGKHLYLTDRNSGELLPVEVFVAVLGASQYTYVEAVPSQGLEDFVHVMTGALEFFGGTPKAIVPDNLRAAVKRAHRYEPLINDSFADFASHYGTVILPTRAYKPRDKALVEGAVKIVYSRIFVPLSDRCFFDITELNTAIKEHLVRYNSIGFRGRDHSRRILFEEVEKGHLGPLPGTRYHLKRFSMSRTHKNSHVWLKADKHYYSVPYRYIGERMKLAYTRQAVEIYHAHERIAVHPREKGAHGYTTDAKHLPPTHRYVMEWHPDRFLGWASKIGPATKKVIARILDKKLHPEQGYRSCMGILSLAKKVGDERLEGACLRAVHYGNYNYRTIRNILDHGLEAIPLEDNKGQQGTQLSIEHRNVRGKDYYS